MKRILSATALAGLLLCGGAREASAQPQGVGFSVNRFDPSDRGSDFFSLESLDFRGNLRPAFGVVGEWAYKPLVLKDATGGVRSAVVSDQFFLHPGASLVVADRLRVAFDLPIQAFADGSGGTLRGIYYPPPSGASLGDIRVSADVRLLGEYRKPLSLAFGLQAYLPTGDTAAYTGDDGARFVPHVLLAGGIGAIQYAARAGFTYRGRDGTFGGSALGSEIFIGAGGGVRVLSDALLLGGELVGSTAVNDPFKTRTTPLELLVGPHYTFLRDFRVGAGAGIGLAAGYGTPAVRGILGIEYAPAVRGAAGPLHDRDKDGIDDDLDACPDVPGVTSKDPQQHGCPPQRDRDGDKIMDDDDACPTLAGRKTDDPRTNGCPPDSDGDGVPDPIDACVAVPGVQQADPKKNGCPPDSDDDGIIDEEDACPDVSGMKTADPKTNGCPDPDRDKDGVLNEQDACPDEPGKADPDPKRNGCPKAFVQNGQIKILDQVKFKTGSAAILPGKDSQEVLSAVLKVLTDHPEIKKVRIEGHTDNQGSATTNKKLSADRAASVVAWLVSHGVESNRLASEGFGSERPLDSNANEAGRKNNRRVEFHIEDPAPPPPPPAAPDPAAAAPPAPAVPGAAAPPAAASPAPPSSPVPTPAPQK